MRLCVSASLCRTNTFGQLHTFWQSDGTQPHWVSIQFAERTSVCLLCVYLDHRVDESYTPRRVTLHAGSKPADLQQVGGFTLSEPCGWVTVALSSDGIEASQEAARAKPLRCFLLRIVIHTMHQSGRDTHVRQLKVYSPCSPAGARVSVPGKPQQVQFTSEQFHMFSCVR